MLGVGVYCRRAKLVYECYTGQVDGKSGTRRRAPCADARILSIPANTRPQTRTHKPQTLNPETLNPKLQTLSPETLRPKPTNPKP